jgi:hypothetical protein
MKCDCVEAAIREEADWMARQGYPLPNEADCKAWYALARCVPTMARGPLDGQSFDFDSTNLNGKWRIWRRKLPDDAWSDNEIALRIIFCHAVWCVGSRAFTISELQAEAEAYRLQASRLREEAVTLDRGPGSSGHVAALNAAAAYCDEQAKGVWWPANFPGLIARRSQGDPSVRGYCARLADETRTIYGRDLRGIIANIANWAFKRSDVTSQRVRDWLKGGVS